MGSSNGTFVNGQRVQGAILRPGDIVQIGGVAIRLDFDAGLTDDLDLRCERCGRMVSRARCEDGQVFELGQNFLGPECARTAVRMLSVIALVSWLSSVWSDRSNSVRRSWKAASVPW